MVSRIAKKPVIIPKDVNLDIKGQKIIAKGPKGQLEYNVHDIVEVTHQDDNLIVNPKKEVKQRNLFRQLQDKAFVSAISGTTRANINNMVIGVSQGFERKLLLVGVGYRAQMQGKNLNLSLGFSHPVIFEIPDGIVIEMPTQTEIFVKGIDKQLVGQIAANIRAVRPVEPYKGKGVRYSDERVVLKETKKK